MVSSAINCKTEWGIKYYLAFFLVLYSWQFKHWVIFFRIIHSSVYRLSWRESKQLGVGEKLCNSNGDKSRQLSVPFLFCASAKLARPDKSWFRSFFLPQNDLTFKTQVTSKEGTPAPITWFEYSQIWSIHFFSKQIKYLDFQVYFLDTIDL